MTERVLRDIRLERLRVDGLVRQGLIPVDLAARGGDVHHKLSVCHEEVGEVVKAVLDGESNERVREEVVQAAACYAALAESLT